MVFMTAEIKTVQKHGSVSLSFLMFSLSRFFKKGNKVCLFVLPTITSHLFTATAKTFVVEG